jgi:ribosomal protein L11 methyltransferase
MQTTHELQISSSSISRKEKLITTLQEFGVESFVENNLFLDEKTSADTHPILSEEVSTGILSVYSYDLDYINSIKEHLGTTEFAQSCVVKSFETSSWTEGWKKYFKPILTEKFCVLPPWEKNPDEDKDTICIEPGMAFGTGQHATTKLCLKLLEKLADTKNLENSTVLDLGAGSGILSIAAAKLKAPKVIALDIDNDSVLASCHNAKINKVAIEAICLSCEKFLDNHKRSYDLIFANILHGTIMENLRMIKKVCAPGAYVIISGILEEQSLEVIAKAQELGLNKKEMICENDWVAVLLEESS